MNKKRNILLGVLAFLLLAGGGLYFQKPMDGVAAKTPASDILYYYCPMHPNIHRDKPGQCPICNMDLVPKRRDTATAPSTGGAVGKDAPEALKGLAPIQLTDYKQQLIGVKLVTAAKGTVIRNISTVGRRSDLGGGLVADIYSLDIDFVKTGQKAWVTDLNGSGPKMEGVVAGLLPFDDTQSRVRRARISVKGRWTSPYANVLIESGRSAKVAVPAEAVMDTGAHTYVFVQVEPGHFVPREVIVGAKGDDLWEISDGLMEGEKVVSGANFLVDADSRLSAILNN
jgi:hypothetical protein